ncbi:MAG TPA: ABC transporter substrate-binding protein [Acidimicrobiia bacterium]|nr:ABC transporter substrate-binding protein [Acidimicrobiia bacterium]
MTLRQRKWWRVLAVITALALVAAACGDDDDEEGQPDTTDETSAPDVQDGGTLVIGAEQEPECTDWIASCSGSSWGYWMMNVTTLPRSFDIVKDGEDWVYEYNSDLLTGEPVLDDSTDKPTVTYEINPEAVWSDGEPITSTDFKYTWEQIATGDDIYDTTGYADVESVDDSDPSVAVVTYSKVYAGWKGIFGGQYGILPSHILEGQDRSAMMANGYEFSGGPWKIDRWEKGVQAVLVPNENWWGEPPILDEVVFQFITDTSAEFQAFQSGQVSAIYPQPQPDTVAAIEQGVEGAGTDFTGETGNLEALWFNNSAFPFDTVAARQAFSYAIDRPALVERLFGPLGVTEPSNALNPPIFSGVSDVDAFSFYEQDVDKVAELLEGDGWVKGDDGIYAKDGQKFAATLKTTTGNARRELTAEVLQAQLEEVGIQLDISLQEAGDLFGDQLPRGDFQVALYAQVATTLEPALCAILCSKNIPSEANNQSGQNWQRVSIPEMDPLLETVDGSLDQDERVAAQKEADGIMAENAVALPLDPLPNILLWKEAEIVGDLFSHPILGPFWNIHTWGLAA